MQDGKEEVRARLNIEDVVGEYVVLKRAGRNFKGLSPFTSEKTPSFVVSPEKQIWHDFSSNRGGDVFSFVMEVEGMDFRTALEHLARKAGVDLSAYQSEGSRQLAQKKRRLLQMHDLAAKYFQTSLVRNQSAIDYVFAKRRLSKEIVQSFSIGYAPDSSQALVNFLRKKGFTDSDLKDSGLVNRYGGDLFRGRMTVALMDASGQVIGFTGRIIGDIENAPKYLNTPQTVLYDKSGHVFGLSQAKDAIRNNDYVVIVEGNLDVVSSHQVGVRQVVATAGTAMTERHLKTLKRLTSDIRLAFDGDQAGLAATERAIAIASQVGVELTIASMPEGSKDPDELIQQDKRLWKQAIETTVPAVEWVIEKYATSQDLTSARGKRLFTTASLRLVAQLRDSVEREHYEDMVAQKIGATRATVKSKVEQLTEDSTSSSLKPVKSTGIENDLKYAYQDDLLAAASITPNTHELLRELDLTLLAGEQRQILARYLVDHPSSGLDESADDLQEIDTYVKIVLLRADTRYADWSEQDRYFETARLIRQVEHEYKKQTRTKLVADLRQAEADGDDEQVDILKNQLHSLIKEIARGQRR